MACSLTLTGRDLPCRDALGGIERVYIAEWQEGLWASPNSTTGIISATSASLTVTLQPFATTKNASSLTQSGTGSVENGTMFYTQTLTLVLPKLTSNDIVNLQELGYGRLAVVVMDVNGDFWIMGHTRGCELAGGTVTTGTATGDLSGMTLEITAEEATMTPEGNTSAAFVPSISGATFNAFV